MSTPILLRKKTPFDGVPPEVFADLAAFVRRAAPRWEDGSSNLDRLTQRHAHQRELVMLPSTTQSTPAEPWLKHSSLSSNEGG